jgi:predicted nucleic acid-binding protein
MISDFPVIIDSCVLVPAALRDTLLRLAEKRLFLPKWTDQIIAEMIQTLEGSRFNKTTEQTTHLVDELRTHFGDAWVENYAPLVSKCSNHEKDRHVLAAAIAAHAELIVTANLKHFPAAAIAPWNVEVSHPDEFLIDVYYLNPELVVHTLHEQASELDRKLEEQLLVMRKGVPKFVQLVTEALRLEPSATPSSTADAPGVSVRKKLE